VYFLCALQKAIKVVGRFHFLDIVKNKPGYLRYIPSTVRQIRRILLRFPDLADMAAILLRHLPGVNECAP
jgi:aminoglycoside/choline kinase family phosphotransferase